MKIEFKKAMIIVARLLNEHLNQSDIPYTKEEESAVRLVRNIANEDGWTIELRDD
tara:strand:- start:183 stop:347 length:165 start_codon:yes stop_codon:yes gene_type:complete